MSRDYYASDDERRNQHLHQISEHLAHLGEALDKLVEKLDTLTNGPRD
jgi:hypothetical protein